MYNNLKWAGAGKPLAQCPTRYSYSKSRELLPVHLQLKEMTQDAFLHTRAASIYCVNATSCNFSQATGRHLSFTSSPLPSPPLPFSSPLFPETHMNETEPQRAQAE